MKTIIKLATTLVCVALFCTLSTDLLAQPRPPGSGARPQQVPIDAVIGLLAFAGVGFTYWKLELSTR